jgi:hypothetical protein
VGGQSFPRGACARLAGRGWGDEAPPTPPLRLDAPTPRSGGGVSAQPHAR